VKIGILKSSFHFGGPLALIAILAGCSMDPSDRMMGNRIPPPEFAEAAPNAPEMAHNAHADALPQGFSLDDWSLQRDFDEPLRLDIDATRPSSGPSTNSSAPINLFSLDSVKRVEHDIAGTFTAPAHWDAGDWLLAGGVAAGIGVTAAFDSKIQKAVQRNRNGTTDRIFKDIEPFGTEYAAGVIGAFYLGGELFHDERAKSVALDAASASLIASVLIGLPVKYTVGRGRPSEHHATSYFAPFSGTDSFPSGHSTEAFAVATVIAEHYDSPWIKVASYSLASAVGFARLNNNAHWASDGLAGAAIGTFVGHTVVHLHGNQAVVVSPMMSDDMRGLQLTWSY